VEPDLRPGEKTGEPVVVLFGAGFDLEALGGQ
jgi:hypothetical protein